MMQNATNKVNRQPEHREIVESDRQVWEEWTRLHHIVFLPEFPKRDERLSTILQTKTE
jgi:hypothetical protein